MEIDMRTLFQILRNLFTPSPEALELEKKRARREILLVMLSLDTQGVECPSLWEICERLKTTRRRMGVQELFGHCMALEKIGLMQKVGDGKNPFFILSDEGLNELGFPGRKV
jgi:hypothetical protein